MEGQYRLKLAHTYLDDQTQPQITAGADTGYCGNVVLDDGTIVTSSYGKFDPDKTLYRRCRKHCDKKLPLSPNGLIYP